MKLLLAHFWRNYDHHQTLALGKDRLFLSHLIHLDIKQWQLYIQNNHIWLYKRYVIIYIIKYDISLKYVYRTKTTTLSTQGLLHTVDISGWWRLRLYCTTHRTATQVGEDSTQGFSWGHTACVHKRVSII